MKAIFVIAILFSGAASNLIHAQNVGIGTAAPAYPLTVMANGAGKGLIQRMGPVEAGIFSTFLSGMGNVATFGTLTNHPLGISAGNSIEPAITILTDGRVGIGTGADITPYALGVYGETGLYGTLTAKGANFTSIKVGNNGTTVSGMQHGVHTAGASATNQLVTTITFASPFSSAPRLFASVRHDPSWNVLDAFAITIKSVSTTQAVLIIRRIDTSAAWSQLLLVDWMAVN